MRKYRLSDRVETDTSRLRVDLVKRVADGVRFLSPKSKNGNTYPTLGKQFKKYDRARVFLNHDLNSVKAGRQRDIRLWAATVSDPDANGYCKVRFNKNKAGDYLMQLMNDSPDLFGMSPTHVCETEIGPEGKTVKDIISVVSVDAVLNPATTSSIFEEIMAEESPEVVKSCQELLGEAMAAAARDGEHDLAAKILKLLKKSGEADAPDEAEEADADEAASPVTEEVATPSLAAQLADALKRLAKVEEATKKPRRVPRSVEQQAVTEEVATGSPAVPTLTGGATLEQARAYWAS